MPSRDYYLKSSSEGDLAAYHRYMTQIAVLLGADPEIATSDLQEVVNFEIRLANVSWFCLSRYFVWKCLVWLIKPKRVHWGSP